MRFELKHFKETLQSEVTLQSPSRIASPEMDHEILLEVKLTAEDEAQLNTLKLNLEESGEPNPRIVHMYELELRRTRWKLSHNCPTCRVCGAPEARLYGAHQVCHLCFLQKSVPHNS